ncbi:hypothetical protein Syun_001110 [Stephania yunnanensis]|uniref:RBR-type E3 ubiquitin transferase n=1 Tax=Stephania yunnanensis TaxID=152371 RepID=A0AAP0Q661_9MAGN
MDDRENRDFDIAFALQMQEAMNDSLLEQQQPSQPEEEEHGYEDQIAHLQTLELLHKYKLEMEDNESSQAEMRRVREELQRRVHDHRFAREISRIPEPEWQKNGDNVEKPFGEGSSSSSTPAGLGLVEEAEPFRLYFKGLFSDERWGSVAAVAAAVCDPSGMMVLKVQKPLLGDWKAGWMDNLELKVEVKGLMEGLTAALSVDIKRIDFFCDYYPLYQYITMRWLVKQQTIGTVIDQVILLQRKFESCRPFFVARNDIRYAFKLARGALESQITRSAKSNNSKNVMENCSICLEDIVVGQMFSIDGCLHRYCFSCMKQHVEVKLLNGVVPRCPHEKCNSKLDIHNSKKFLSPELVDKMMLLLKEESIPVTEKIYCPVPLCSMLMSKKEALECVKGVAAGANQSGIRKCIKCDALFCINCMVPWHKNMNCRDYKRLNPHPNAEDAKLKSLANQKLWRQCVKCSHMIELAEGCYHITCRCGYEFCYTCGASWIKKEPTCSCRIWDERNILDRQRR